MDPKIKFFKKFSTFLKTIRKCSPCSKTMKNDEILELVPNAYPQRQKLRFAPENHDRNIKTMKSIKNKQIIYHLHNIKQNKYNIDQIIPIQLNYMDKVRRLVPRNYRRLRDFVQNVHAIGIRWCDFLAAYHGSPSCL